MTRSPGLRDLARSSAALVQDYDVTGMLARTVNDAAEHLGAAAGGLIVANRHDDLELLSATSHAAAELETYQALSQEGPCATCMSSQEAATFDRDAVSAEWPELGELMAGAGYRWVVATPLRWRGTTLGGLNLFWSTTLDDVRAAEVGAQVYADILSLLIVNSDPISPEAARERVAAALEQRAVIEQAKGVLAQEEGLDMPAAYRRLLDMEGATGRHLTEVARSLLRAVEQRGPRDDGR